MNKPAYGMQVPPTPERLRHGKLEIVEVMPEGTMVWNEHSAGVLTAADRHATLLERYWRDQLLVGNTEGPAIGLERAASRFDAGTRLQGLYDATGARARVMGIYGPRSLAHHEMTDDQADDFEKYQALISKMQRVSIMAASAVVNLCIYEFDPVDRRELIRGLDVLVRHWGL